MDRKAIVDSRRGMKQISKNGIREFVLNSFHSNTIMSNSRGHGLSPIVRKKKDMRFNESIICKKARYKIHKIKAPSITTNNISNMDILKPFMVIPTNAQHIHIPWQP